MYITGSQTHWGCKEPLEIGQPCLPDWRKITMSKLLGMVSCWVSNISQNGDSATSLGNLLQCLTFSIEFFFFFFLTLWMNFRYFRFCPLYLVLWAPLGRFWLHLLFYLPPCLPGQSFHCSILLGSHPTTLKKKWFCFEHSTAFWD